MALDTRARSHPLTARVRTGIRQRIGLRAKLSSKAKAFFIKINITVETLNGATRSPSFSRAAISSEMGLVLVVGVARPRALPIPKKRRATKIHHLYFIAHYQS